MARTRLFFLCTVLIGLAGAGSTLWGQAGGFAYVANCGDVCFGGTGPGNVSAYAIDGATGALTEIPDSPFPAGTVPVSVTVDPTGRFAYVANFGFFGFPSNVSAYTIDGVTGALREISGSPFGAGSGSLSVTVDPTGRFAYVANCGSTCAGGDVSAYTIDGTTGALTEVAGSPFPAGAGPASVTVDPTGQFAYVANSVSNNVSAYTINGATGALTPVAGSPFPAGLDPRSVAVDPTGQFAYVANNGSFNVSAYIINGTKGALTEVAGSPFPAGTFPASVTVDPTGRFSYVANEGGLDPGSVSAYTIDGTTGALTPVAGSPFPAGHFPRSVAVDPTGLFAYVANEFSNDVSAYDIDRTTGALTGSPFGAGSRPLSVTTTAGPRPAP